MEEDKPKYVLGIEGSANKVGVGKSITIQASWTFKEIYSPTLARHLSLLQALASSQDKQPSIIPNKLSPL